MYLSEVLISLPPPQVVALTVLSFMTAKISGGLPALSLRMARKTQMSPADRRRAYERGIPGPNGADAQLSNCNGRGWLVPAEDFPGLGDLVTSGGRQSPFSSVLRNRR